MFCAKNIFGNYICARCGKKAELTIDHFIPKSCGMPVNKEGNLVGLCVECNRQKANKVVLPSWYTYLTQEQQSKLDCYLRYCSVWVRNNCDDPNILEYVDKL